MARLFVVLALDVVLIGAGIAMISTYLDSRSDVDSEATSAKESPAPVSAQVEVLPPSPVSAEELARERKEAKAAASASKSSGSSGAAKHVHSTRPASTAPAKSPPIADPEPPDARASPASGDKPTPPPDVGRAAKFATPPPDAGAETSDKDVQIMARKIAGVVDRHQSQLKRCYERAAKATNPNDPLQGRIDIRFSVMPDGSAANVRAARNSSGSKALETCVVGLVKSWDFPAAASEPLDFMWPFIFKVPQ